MSITNMSSKFYTRDACLKNIDVKEFLLFAQDRDEARGNKCFYRIPLRDLQKLDLTRNQNLYEILPPGEPVKPYFDLEMEYPELDEETIYDRLDLFLTWLMEEMKTLFAVNLVQEDFVILNSSRENKLSFHIVIQEHICFASVADQKVFIAYLWQRFLNPVDEKEEKMVGLLSYDVKGETRFIFDNVPYGNFQSMRLVGQSKKGKPYVLVNVNQKWQIQDTLIRLYNGIGDRNVANVQPLTQTQTSKGSRKRKIDGISRKMLPQDSDYTINGAKLFETLKMTKADLEKLPNYLRYLSLISNTSQHWQIRWNIACAVRSCGGTQKDYKTWASLSTKYNENNSIITEFDKLKTTGERTYGLPYLKKLAKLSNPEYFNESKECLEEYFKFNTMGINVIKETSQFVSQQGTADENNIMVTSKAIVLHAYLGRGKTTAIKRKLVSYQSYLFMSPRQTFARFIASDFECDCYLDDIFDSNKLVISVESLLRCESEQDYECIVIDESESIFTQFSSHTCNGNHVLIFNRLMEYIKKAKCVIFADAFITNRTLDFVRSLGCEATMIQNDTSPVAREAVEIHPNLFAAELIDSINAGDKNYVCYSSVNKLIAHQNILKGNAMANPVMRPVLEKSLIYHSKASDSVFTTLAKINNTWKKSALVMTSPSNTVGCSYSPADVVPDFNKVWINAAPTCCVRDTFQTHMRVRHLKDNKMMFCVPLPQALNFAKLRYELQFSILSDFKENVQEKKFATMRLIDELKAQRVKCNPLDECKDLNALIYSYNTSVPIPDALRSILHFNLWETTISCKFYKDMFYEYLGRCGYSYFDGKKACSKDDVNNECNLDSDSNAFLYDSIQNISYEQADHYYELIRAKNATVLQKMELQKYLFEKKVHPELDVEMKGILFYDFYCPSHMRVLFDNAYIEHKQDIVKVLYNDQGAAGSGFELNKMAAVQYSYILKLNTLLGIESTIKGNQIIRKDKVHNAISYLTKERQHIYSAFGMRDQATNGNLNYGHILRMIKMMYKNWSGMKISDSKDHYITESKFDFSQLGGEPIEIFKERNVKEVVDAEEVREEVDIMLTECCITLKKDRK